MADSVYVNNDYELTVDCDPAVRGVVLTGALTKRIYYKKPDDSTGYWNATLSGTKDLVYDVTNVENDQSGVWWIYGYVVSSAGKIYKGKPASLEVMETWQAK